MHNNGGCIQLCRNNHGGFKCECKEGFHTIEEEGEIVCKGKSHYKNKIMHIQNTLLLDIDECLTNNGECDHFCVNDEGGAHCTCRNGYSLNDDDSTCGKFVFRFFFKPYLTYFYFKMTSTSAKIKMVAVRTDA